MDLIQELRAREAPPLQQTDLPVFPAGWPKDELCQRAADRIEALHKALKRATDYLYDMGDYEVADEAFAILEKSNGS